MNLIQKIVEKATNNYTNKYRRYSDEKAKIPMDLSPEEYEAEIKRLIKKYKI